MDNCIFCKIAKGNISSVKILENENFFAFLDIMPAVDGMTLVVPKKHFDSKIFEMPDKEYTELLLFSKKVANILKKSLNPERVSMVVEGLDVSHVHVKLYPYQKDSEGLCLKNFSQKSNNELQEVANKIMSNQ